MNEDLDKRAAMEVMGWTEYTGFCGNVWEPVGLLTSDSEVFEDTCCNVWSPSTNRDQLWMVLGKLNNKTRYKVFKTLPVSDADYPHDFAVFKWFIDTPPNEILRVVLSVVK